MEGATPPATATASGRRPVVTALTVVGIALLAWLAVRHLRSDSRIIWLRSDGDAKWIRPDHPFDVGAKFEPVTTASFATQFTTSNPSDGASLQVTALRRFTVRVDGIPFFDSGPVGDDWRTVRLVLLPQPLTPGSHVLQFDVANAGGPALLRVRCPALGLHTDAHWQATDIAVPWRGAAEADRPWTPQLPPKFRPTLSELADHAPLLIFIFLAGFLPALLYRKPVSSRLVLAMRLSLLLAWMVLGLHNLFRLPLAVGYDVDSHYQYIDYLAKNHTLPPPEGGWQYFQSPLYFAISAIMAKALAWWGVAAQSIPYLLRLIPLACGAAMVELSYRVARTAYPQRYGLQAAAAVIGGLLPVNLYMSQTVSNEVPAAALGALLSLLLMRLLARPERAGSLSTAVLIGATLALAFLTKVSTLIWAAPLAFAYVVAWTRARSTPRLRVSVMASGIITAIAMGGWFVVYSLRRTGTPLLTHSTLEQARWWQDPGYRTIGMLTTFGRVFSSAVYNGTSSLWDSLFGTLWGYGIPSGTPPYHYGLMACGLWLGLVITIAMIAGVVRAFVDPPPPPGAAGRDGLRLAAVVIGCYLLAIVHAYLTLPIYGCGKASYFLSATPCLALLAAAGFDWLSKLRFARATIAGFITCWAVLSFVTYFVDA